MHVLRLIDKSVARFLSYLGTGLFGMQYNNMVLPCNPALGGGLEGLSTLQAYTATTTHHETRQREVGEYVCSSHFRKSVSSEEDKTPRNKKFRTKKARKAKREKKTHTHSTQKNEREKERRQRKTKAKESGGLTEQFYQG